MNTYVQTIRKLIGTQRIFMPGVRAIVTNDAGEVLLQRRTDIPLWGLPAGAIEIGESACDALKREVAEETSIEVLEAQPMGLYTGLSQQFTYPNGDQVQGLSTAFIVRRWRGDPRADGVEGEEVRFFPMSALPEDIFPMHKQVLDDYRNYDGGFVVK
jgi:mutator protein MutT